jgi:hypothetical protein
MASFSREKSMGKFPKTFPLFEVEATPTEPSELGERQEQTNPSFRSAVSWMLVNAIATVGIVC